jgi:Uroporphyrinogen decarboxylase (URO-D)
MTPRDLFREIMFYGSFDRMPVIHWKGWPETYVRWHADGMPEGVDEQEYFGTVPRWLSLGGWMGPVPKFEERVLEETEEYVIRQNAEGEVVKDWKHQSNIPQHIDSFLKGSAEWPEYKRRLQPDASRIDRDEIMRTVAEAKAKGLPLSLKAASLMGWPRNWMGVERFCMFTMDEPDCFADMVDTLADLSCWVIDEVMGIIDVTPDLGFGWEDICGRCGPFVTPAIFERCVAPGYRKIRNKLESHGITLFGIDSDGDITALVGPWLEAGVNIQFPIEIGAWEADPMAFRKEYGKELRIVGGFNKMVLEDGPAAIDAEIDRRMPLMRDGGCILQPDHFITPGVSLENYKYYLERVRELRL